MLQNAQYSVWFRTPAGEGHGVISLMDGDVSGGDNIGSYTGTYVQEGDKFAATIAAAEQPVKVGSFKPNPFGLYDMGGGVDQWVEDCWHKNYQGAPWNGSPWVGGDCASHVIRSGSWKNDARYARPANRDSYDTNVRYPTHGLRVALSP